MQRFNAAIAGKVAFVPGPPFQANAAASNTFWLIAARR
ncbi:MAG: hypothetical protein ACI83P_000463 [Janthinobacterium sp.]|jgi:hypothetical protein